MRVWKLSRLLAAAPILLIAGCASDPQSIPKAGHSQHAWESAALASALANSSRPQADKDRDADRKPAQLMAFFGVQRGMTAMDLQAGGGFMTEVLSMAVGPTGKVYAQNQGINKAIVERLSNNRLPNVVPINGPLTSIPPNSLDVAITVMNLHDIYNSTSSAIVTQALQSIYDLLKSGGVLGIVDHAGVAGADNAKLHRMIKQQAIDVTKAAGFVLEVESNVLANPTDDHTKSVIDPALRGKTDQFTLKFRKPK